MPGVGNGFLKDSREPQLENPETVSRGDENEGFSLHDSDLESLGNTSRSTVDSRKDRPGSSCVSSSYSGNFSDNDCLDDWEAIADALTAYHQHPVPSSAVHIEPHSPDAHPKLLDKTCGTDISKHGCKNMVPRTAPKIHAWRLDETFRPQSLPNLSKLSCPICYKDLDPTDQNFQPCICGFRLCLFCYKRIFEVGDGRCPGCRRPYDPVDGNAVVNGGSQPLLKAGVQFILVA